MNAARALFERFYADNRHLAIRRAWHGTLLNLIPTGAYYTAYALIIIRALAGALTVGDLTLLVGAFSRARNIMESLVSGLVGVSEQALFIKDLFDFFETKPLISFRAERPARSPADSGWVRIFKCFFRLYRIVKPCAGKYQLSLLSRRKNCACRRERGRQDDSRQIAGAAV